MPCRRAPLELTMDAKLETIGRSRSEPAHRVTRATMPLACAHDDLAPATSAPEGRALRRQGAPAWRAGGVAGSAATGSPGADSAGSASLGCGAGLSKAERPGLCGGVADDEVVVAARSIAKSSLSKPAPGTVWKILSRQEIRPRRISYYRRDPERKNGRSSFTSSCCASRQPDASLVAYI